MFNSSKHRKKSPNACLLFGMNMFKCVKDTCKHTSQPMASKEIPPTSSPLGFLQPLKQGRQLETWWHWLPSTVLTSQAHQVSIPQRGISTSTHS